MVEIIENTGTKPLGTLYEVSQFGWLDLAEAYRNHNVPASLDGLDAKSNGIEDPSSILGKPTDVFDAMRMKSYIEKSARKGGNSKNSPISSPEPNSTE